MVKETTHEHTPRCMGSMLLVLGVLIILNSVYAWFNWAIFVGGILALKGLLKLTFPVCGCQKK